MIEQQLPFQLSPAFTMDVNESSDSTFRCAVKERTSRVKLAWLRHGVFTLGARRGVHTRSCSNSSLSRARSLAFSRRIAQLTNGPKTAANPVG